MGKYIYIFILVVSIVVQLDAVTVSPSLCPTNKIAPHRRNAGWEQSRPRTFGLLYDLFVPRRPQQFDPVNDLEEQPQEDDPEDCGEIEDYDESDLSSITPGAQRRKTNRKDRDFFGTNYEIPAYHPAPSRPQRPTRPPYGSGGTYGFYGYRPTSHHYPTGNKIKPVKEDVLDRPQMPYRLGLIGGTIGHIIGFPPVRPTTEDTPRKKPNLHVRFPEGESYSNNRRNRSQQTNKSTNIFGSFIDLLFN